MDKKLLKLNILSLSLIFFACSNPVFAGYDTVKAFTIDNKNIDKKEEEEFVVTDNDPDLPDFTEEQSFSGLIKNKKSRFFKRRKNKDIEEEEVQNEENIKETVKQENVEVKDKNKFKINADKISYDETEGNVYADGHVEIISSSQNVVLKADKAVLDKPTQKIKLSGNVTIVKDGVEMTGQSLVIDLNEENIIMDNPTMDAYSFIINAQESYLIANNLQMINGTVETNNNKEFPMIPNRFYRYAPAGIEELYDPSLQKDTKVNNGKKLFRIDAKEIVMTSYKDHNSVLLKGSDVYINNHKVIPNTDLEFISDKEIQHVETNSLEAGTFRVFGTYVGYGFVSKLPKGQMLKIMPAVTYGSGNIGVGILGRHRSQNSVFEAGYSSSTEKFVARGVYKFGNGFSFRYGRNAYITEGFMGTRRAGYAGQLAFEKSYFDKDHRITFRHGTYAGLFSDYKKKQPMNHYFATTRFRYSMELSKVFLEYKNQEQDMKITFSANSQAAATLYGTGDTVGVIRIGPTIGVKLKRWESNIGYFLSGIHGDSPFIFDKYRYGRSALVFNNKFNFNNKFALGYCVTLLPNKDNYEHDMFAC